jgi:hypothetical protein
MRRLLILAVLLAGPADAQSAGDRYGSGDPARNGQTPAAQRYSGRVLTWAGKTLPPAAGLRPPASPPGFASAAPNLRGVAPQAFQPQAPYAAPVRQALTAPVAPAAPTPRTAPTPPAAQAAALPTSLYGAASHGPVLAGGPPAHAGTEARLYSLHRAYGLQPDAIPEPPAGQRYVLVGPPDHATAPKDTGGAQAGGLADAPF